MTTATVTASNGNEVTVDLSDDLVLTISYKGEQRNQRNLRDEIPEEHLNDELIASLHKQVEDTKTEHVDELADGFDSEDYFEAGEPDYSVCIAHELLGGQFEAAAMATAQDARHVVMKIFGKNDDDELELIWRKRCECKHGISAGDAIADFNPEVAEGMLVQVMMG